MKRRLLPVLCMAFILTVTGCSGSGASGKVMNQTTGVRDVIQSRIDTEKEKTSQTSESSSETTRIAITVEPPKTDSFDDIDERLKGTGGIDIDLTNGNANLVYAQVYSMLYSPESYIGKKVKMQGQFTFYQDEATGKYYYACFISDAAACCTQGFEFIPAKKVKYPDDFPKVGTEISVTGEFFTYQEGNETFAALKDAKFKTV